MDDQVSQDRERKKAAAEMLVLALLEERSRHGYEIAKLIELRSGGALVFHVASLYPLLARLEGRDLIAGRWLERPGQRRRRFYRLTDDGRRALATHRRHWIDFVRAVDTIAQLGFATPDLKT
jgi:DNA-binding PadR family transcriptional regulator